MEQLPPKQQVMRILQNRIARNQKWLRSNPWCASMVNPTNAHADRAKAEILEDKAKLKELRAA
jgi:hypothetical protein